MKRKSLKMKGEKGRAERRAIAAPSSVSEPKQKEAAVASQPVSTSVATLEYPPPHVVAECARDEANPRLVADYLEAIQVLRDEKKFTFREIAEWLTEKFGIETDHNAVYRAYTRGMPDQEAMWVAREDDEAEREATGT